jgi:Ankyrin repeats (3 copies)
MFPAPYDALPLPPRPSVKHYKKLAKDLVKACRSAESSGMRTAIRAWAERWVESLFKECRPMIPPGRLVQPERWPAQIEEFARSRLASDKGRPCALADAQFVLARVHGFASWPEFARHIDELRHESSTTSNFEAAAEAIVNGDTNALLTYLLADPELVRARSSREHACTLLHYVAANGVENWRQRTPQNVVEVAEELLDAGAEIDAAAQMYGGDCTTLGLAATSIHPERAGVQIPLLQLLIDRGARVDRPGNASGSHSLVKACFANGRGQAAEFLAQHLSSLDLEEAAGTGHLDAVRGFFNDDGTLMASASQEQLRQGFLWACQFGRNRVIEYLLSLGFDVSAQDHNGQTALHHAVIGAQLETVALLLRHNAPLEVKNSYGGTVLGQVIWCAVNSGSAKPYLPVIELLLEAGAKIEPAMEDELARLLRRRPGSHS